MAFRVIVVGAGFAGLALARCLQLANIDYIILESRDTHLGSKGAAQFILPHGMRILDQFGLLNDIGDNATHMKQWVHLGTDGGMIGASQFFTAIEENHGYPTMLLHRRNWLKMLSDGLTNLDSHLQTGVQLESVQMTDDGVQAHLADGTTVTGSIIVGADGVHSILRRLLVEADPKALDGQATFTDHHFKILYGRSRIPECVKKTQGTFFARHDSGWFMHYAAGKDEACWILYELQPGPPSQGRTRHTDEDADQFVGRYRTEVFSHELDLSIGTIWDDRTFFKMDWMDEGISKKWHHNRAVLLGDAVLKVGPAQASGANNALEFAVTLGNELCSLIQKHQNPTSSDISSAFSKYQATLEPKMRIFEISNRQYHTSEAWPSWFQWLIWRLMRSVSSFRPTLLADLLLGPLIRRSNKLFYVEHKDWEARIPWIDVKVSPLPTTSVVQQLRLLFWALIGYRPDWKLIKE